MKTYPIESETESNLTYEKSNVANSTSRKQTVHDVNKSHEQDASVSRLIRVCCCSLSSCTAFGFVSVSIVVALIVWTATFLSGYLSTQSAINSLRQEIRTTSLNKLNTLLLAPMSILIEQEQFVRELGLDLSYNATSHPEDLRSSSMHKFARQAASVLNHHPELGISLYVQFPDGNHLQVRYTDPSRKTIRIEAAFAETSTSTFTFLDASSLEYKSSSSEDYTDNISNTDWYQQAVFANRPLVSVAHELHEPDFTGAKVGFTYTIPLFDKNGTLKCVFAADLGLNNIGNILNELRIGKTGTSFLMQRTGYMIATSFDTQLADGSGTRIHATDTASPTHRKIAQMLEDSVTIKHVPDEYSLSFDGYIADIYLIDPVLYNGVDILQTPWIFVTALPLFRDYTQVILWSNLVSLAVTAVLITLVAISSVLLYIFIFVRPLKVLISDLEAVQSMQLDQIRERNLSYIFETRELQQRFYKAVHYLKLFRQFLPQSLLEAQVQYYNHSNNLEHIADQPESDDDKNSDYIPREQRRDSTDKGSFFGSHASSRKTKVSSSGSTSRRQKQRAALSTFEIGIKEMKLALVVVSLHRVSQLLDVDIDSFSHQHSGMLNVFGQVVKLHKGTVERFDENFLVCSFFSLRHAVAASVDMKKRLGSLEKKYEQEERLSISFSIGLSWGIACIGVLGCENMRSNKVFGRVYELSERLSLQGEIWPAKIIVDSDTFALLDTRDYIARPLAIVDLKGDEQTKIFEVIGSSKISESEWIYERRDADKVSSLAVYRDAFSALEKQNYKEARSLFNEYLQINLDDSVARKHLQLIENRQQESNSETQNKIES